jgi:glucan phosphoethanolaminetransferase (alkaline phosphatase superfamily)
MIQRIQSIYLLLISILSLVYLNVSYLRFHYNISDDLVLNLKGIWLAGVQTKPDLILSQIPLAFVIILIAILAIITVFLYKNRRIQMKMTMALIILGFISIVILIYYAFSIIAKYKASIMPSILMIIPVLVLIFSILAYRAIRRDEDLVRSYDRLR